MAERVAIVGSRPPKAPPIIGPITREWYEYLQRIEAVRSYVSSLDDSAIVVTCSTEGVCHEAIVAAKQRAPRLTVEVWYPRPDIYGSAAGLGMLNSVLSSSDRAVLWWDGKSRGVELAIDIATRLGLETLVLP